MKGTGLLYCDGIHWNGTVPECFGEYFIERSSNENINILQFLRPSHSYNSLLGEPGQSPSRRVAGYLSSASLQEVASLIITLFDEPYQEILCLTLASQ